MLSRIIYREWCLLRGSLFDRAEPWLFFVVVVCLFPLGLKPDPRLLATIAPGVIWVAALLAHLLALPGVFSQDHHSGMLAQLCLMPVPLPVIVLIKVGLHWLQTGVPIILLAPVLAAWLNLPGPAIKILMLSLVLGTPLLSLLGAVAAALTVSLRSPGLLLALLLLPLYIPILVFGAGAVALAQHHMAVQGLMLVMTALLVLGLTLTPFATAGAIRLSVE